GLRRLAQSARERNQHLGQHASRRLDRDRLPVTMRGHGQERGEGVAVGSRVDRAAGGAAADPAGDMTGVLAPIATQLATGIADIGARLELVAVAGASQLLLQVVATIVDRISSVTANAFAPAVLHGDDAVARPVAGQTLERAGGDCGDALLRVRLD